MKKEMIGKKLSIFLETKKKIHINCFNRFYNGYVKDFDVEKGTINFIDDKLEEIIILFEEINYMEPFLKK